MNKKTILLIIAAVGVLIAILWPPPPIPKFGDQFEGEALSSQVATGANIKGVKLICDESGSMKGYVDFQHVNSPAKNNIVGSVSTMVSRIKQHYNPSDFSAECRMKYNKVDDFQSQLVANTAFTSGSSFLWDLLNKGVSYASDTTVSVVISDMVLSYGAAAIINSRDLYYNQHHLDGLKGMVTSSMTDAKQKGLDILVLSYHSDFNGHYYYNSQENFTSLSPQRKQNYYDNCLMEDRPYYIMLIGSKANLKSLIKNGCYADCANMYASFIEACPVFDTNVKYNVNYNQDVWIPGHYKGEPGGFYSKFTPQENSSFSISCASVGIPRYYFKDQNSFMAECGTNASAGKVHYNDSTIALTLTTDYVNTLPEKGKFSADIYAMNDWVNDSSTDSDVNDIDGIKGKTWGLKTLFEGINTVYYPVGYPGKVKVGSISFGYYINK